MNISHVIYLILITVIIALSVTVAVKNNQIDVLHAEKELLQVQVVSAESSIKLQNLKIEEMALNIEQAENSYNENMKELQDKYEQLDNLSSQDKSCNEILEIINKNQKEFLR